MKQRPYEYKVKEILEQERTSHAIEKVGLYGIILLGVGAAAGL